MQRLLLSFFASVLCAWSLCGNNISVSNVHVIDDINVPDYATLTFDVSWENSWRTTAAPANYDAAWVFAKYRIGTGAWRHVRLSAVNTAPAGATVDLLDDVGVIVYSSANQSGPASYTGIELQWELTSDAIAWSSNIEVKVFAIEMVYIPTGSFELGAHVKTSTETDAFHMANNEQPFRIGSEAELPVGTTGNKLKYTDVNVRGADFAGPIPATFPKGYNAFYLMKYETSQEQWVDFFNTLSPAHQALYDITDVTGKDTDGELYRNGVSFPAGSTEATTSLPGTASGYNSIRDMMAYFDWSGLRPMTEMEFEKAARGPLAPVNGEYAWGNASVANTQYALVNEGQDAEVVAPATLAILTSIGNATYLDTHPSSRADKGPLRVGIYAGSTLVNDRVTAGAGYYGNMELSGNQWEGVITVGNAAGRAFTNVHGDGSLDASGLPDVPTWPTSGAAVGCRGGRSDNLSEYMRTADRAFAVLIATNYTSRYYWLQWRGVRGL